MYIYMYIYKIDMTTEHGLSPKLQLLVTLVGGRGEKVGPRRVAVKVFLLGDVHESIFIKIRSDFRICP